MSSKICKHQATEKIPLKSAFDGFIISIYSEKDVVSGPGDEISKANYIDPFKVVLTLKNNKTSRPCWTMTLGRLYMLQNKFKPNVAFRASMDGGFLTPVDGETDPTKARLHEYSIGFDYSYDGDYTLTVEMKDAVPAGSRISSYVEITPEWSDEPMYYETIIDDYPLSQTNVDLQLGSGIEEVVLLEDMDITVPFTLGIFTSFAQKIKRASYNSSSGRMEEYSNHQLQSLTSKFIDFQGPVNMPLLVIHDKEINSEMRVSIENYTTNDKGFVVYTKLLKNPAVDVSIANSDNRSESVHEMMGTIS